MISNTDNRLEELYPEFSSDSNRPATSAQYWGRLRVRKSSKASRGSMLNNERKKSIAAVFVLSTVARDLDSLLSDGLSRRYPTSPRASISCAE